ncbi:hypothetical protein FFLO_02695 [Filobasidium floriforme]|uniref:Structural maintenance of chromosomes protein n=1 Tax=Filobasidium floriforme TaxID=5210 RepID=A0A8K0JM79_9TREE|nr:hypothetical protein FFLO_02695 [Filobasidium floriforme]
MHIKTLTIQGFKSYRDQISVDPFSPKHNVVVGRNGSGKSNFFSAIRFVLSDAYEKLSREERAGLLHEGTGRSQIMSAYVEIVFDNSDSRFPTSLSTLTLRRTIGLKKDEYTLDKKSATKAEVMNLLESAGFSRSNPYYIVPQGRITAITNQKESERLDLLKEIAGTSVYESKRQESMKIMEETNSKRTKIMDLLEKIEERLKELDDEKAELKDFQEKDKERRCLEYAIYQRELMDVEEALHSIEGDHNKNDLETEQTESKIKLSNLAVQSRQNTTQLEDLIRRRTELECLIDDVDQANQDGAGTREDREQELENIETRLVQVREELDQLGTQYEERVTQERQLRQEIDTAQGRLEALYGKQGRSNQFATQAERDAHLREEIETAQTSLADQQGRVEQIRGEVATAQDDLEDSQSRKTEVEASLEENKQGVLSKSEEKEAIKAQMDEQTERRKSLLREDGKLSHSLSTTREEKQNADRLLASMMDKDTNRGLEAIARITKTLKLDGVYGPLYSLFEVDDKYKVAVEVTAGNSLFQVVVDNDDTVTKILNQMRRDNIRGRVTFMPLNRLRTPTVDIPTADDAVPMISKLRFDRTYRLAFEQVFGRTVICRDLETCGSYTKNHGVSAITMDGDRIDRKGSLTGGYHDIRRSRIDAIKAVALWKGKLDTETARHAEVKASIMKLEQEISVNLGKIQVIESQRKAQLDDRLALTTRASWITKENEQARVRVERMERALAEAEREEQSIQTRIEALQAEMGSAFTQNLTAAEIRTLRDLNAQLTRQQEEYKKVAHERSQIGNQKRLLEIELNEDLLRRQSDLQDFLHAGITDVPGAGTQAGSIDTWRGEQQTLQASIEALQETVDQTDGEIDSINQSLAANAARLDELQTQQLQNSRGILQAQKTAERYIVKRQTLTNRQEECNKSIRDLGVLPEEAYKKYTDARNKAEQLVKKLHKVQEHLKGYSHVNKKAFEQYNTFTKQRDGLLERREELDISGESIQDLIETLDTRKDEAIERTFKEVSKYFSETFEKLVPAGRGKLKMLKRLDGEQLETQSQAVRTGIDSYTGVSIEVSFNSKVDEGLQIQQLSGGQKSLVALAMVFSIQKCDPAPFYLFDEIDANLDAQYRTAVAAMIHEMSASAQFITTTFRPEMLAEANKFYGVLFDARKVSTIRTIEQKDAQEFVDVSV